MCDTLFIMSDEYKAERITSMSGASDFPGGHPMPRRRAYRAYASSALPGNGLDEHDIVSIFGLPADALPAEVVTSVQRLLNEAGDLRSQVDAAERHRRLLEDQADHYPGLPCLNAHAFVRELDAVFDTENRQMDAEWGTVAVVHIGGIERAVGTLGINVGDGALRHVWDALHRYALAGEPLAYLGFGAFCWLLIGPWAEDGQKRLSAALGVLHQSPPEWLGNTLDLTVSCGTAPLIAEGGAMSALSAADRNRVQAIA